MCLDRGAILANFHLTRLVLLCVYLSAQSFSFVVSRVSCSRWLLCRCARCCSRGIPVADEIPFLVDKIQIDQFQIDEFQVVTLQVDQLQVDEFQVDRFKVPNFKYQHFKPRNCALKNPNKTPKQRRIIIPSASSSCSFFFFFFHFGLED